jgi:hypothetical protein
MGCLRQRTGQPALSFFRPGRAGQIVPKTKFVARGACSVVGQETGHPRRGDGAAVSFFAGAVSVGAL